MKFVGLLISLSLIPSLSFALADVSLRNNSTGLLKCELRINDKYIPFARLEPRERKLFPGFKLGSAARCFIHIDERSTTVFTYFTIGSSGEYELLSERVECPTCAEPAKGRLATIVVPPNGQAHFTELK